MDVLLEYLGCKYNYEWHKDTVNKLYWTNTGRENITTIYFNMC